MPDDLHRLLKTYDFLQSALDTHGPTMRPSDKERLRLERDALFLDLISHQSSNPRVTAAQIAMFASTLAAMAAGPGDAELLRKACTDATDRLVRQIEQQTKELKLGALARTCPTPGKLGSPQPGEQTTRIFDSMADRIAVFDRDYRYIFTNKSNADFHGRDAGSFVQQPSWSVVGAKCFEELAKHNIDSCFAGRSTSHVARHDAKGRSFIYLISCDPLTDAAGRVTSALLMARDVSHLAIEPSVVWPSPDSE
jgi:PAS domain S-box-containing protein